MTTLFKPPTAPGRFTYLKLAVDDEGVHGTTIWEVRSGGAVLGTVYENWGFRDWPLDRRIDTGFEIANGNTYRTRRDAAVELWERSTNGN